ncbi:MAG TPA: mannose-1-phosphate guanylyltransferase [Gemmatimonadaceae bacterium]|nr:mannose-1-phosphate guanylyltransferase [Gemmatimonadaceae bacterium]
MSTWVVVLAGGVGSRFWPLSTPERPKQLLPLVGQRPLLEEAVRRLGPLVEPSRVLILTNASLRDAVRALLPDVPPQNVIAEPRAGGTAAALAWGAQEINRREGPEAVMISVHADWSVANADRFVATLRDAAAVAEKHHALVTVGVVPTRPDPGFGYIEPGAAVSPGVRRVAKFQEKPDRERAAQMIAGGALWNSGIFVWRVGDFLDDVRRLTPEVAPALHAHSNDIDGFFRDVTPISVDHGVLERSDRVMVIPGDFGWDDVGTWGSLGRVRQLDQASNAMSGQAYAMASSGNVVHAEGTTVVLFGVEDLVVVAKDGLVLVTTVDKSSDLKTLVEALPRGVADR